MYIAYISHFVTSLWISRNTSFRYLLVGSIKLQVSFAKEPYKRDYIPQKKPIISKSLLIFGYQNIGLLWRLWGYQEYRTFDTYMKMYILMYIHRSLWVYIKETYILINLFAYQGISLLDAHMKIDVYILFLDMNNKKTILYTY